MLAEITLSPHTARLFTKLKDNRVTDSILRQCFTYPTRIEAFLGLFYTHYVVLVAKGANQGYLVTPWGEEPAFNGWSPPSIKNNHQSNAPTQQTTALMEIAKSTTDPHSLVSMISKPDEHTFKAILHPTFQRHWYEHLKTAEAKQDFRSRDPQVTYYLTRQGQMEFFVRKALDENVATAVQLKAMETAGKLKGYYSEKIQLMHENAPTTNVQQNFIMGTELTNRFRLFMEDKLKERAELPAPPTDPEEQIEEADILVVPEPPQDEDEVPEFLRMTA